MARSCLLLALLFAVRASASTYNSSVSSATGGAGLAAIEVHDTPFMNPASLPYTQGYFFGAGYATMFSPEFGTQTTYALSVIDNMKETVIPTSLGFVDSQYTFSNANWEHRDLRLAVGNYFTKRSALGFGINYRNSSGGGGSWQQYNMFMGSMFSITKALSLALTVENMLQPPSDVPSQERLPQTIGIGFSYNYKTFVRAKLDFTTGSNNDFGHPAIGGGVEYYWNRWLIGRLGYQQVSELSESISSVGIGFDGPKFNLHYAFQNVQMPAGVDPRHSVDMGFPLW